MLELTARWEEVLLSLTAKVPLLTLPQVASTWFEGDEPSAAESLKKLEAKRLLNRLKVSARPELELPGPIVRYEPGMAAPNFGPVAYQLRSRWTQAPVEQSIYVATSNARRVFGGYLGGRKPRPSDLTHDIHLAQVYLRYRIEKPEIANAWVPEAELMAENRMTGRRVPDSAIYLGGSESPTLFIEFGGAYPKKKLVTFHAACRATAYEIW